MPPGTRFEAGTGNIADAVGVGAVLDCVERVGLEANSPHKHDLLAYATHLRNLIPGLRMPGTARAKAGVISFVIDGMDNVVIGKALNQDGIAVRAGHHCASLSSVVSASNHRCARRLHPTTRMPTLKHWQCLSGASAPVPLVSPERPGTDREIPPMASPGFGCQAPVSRDL
jgi:selenocysteine lyase/cysteine desulfurase